MTIGDIVIDLDKIFELLKLALSWPVVTLTIVIFFVCNFKEAIKRKLLDLESVEYNKLKMIFGILQREKKKAIEKNPKHKDAIIENFDTATETVINIMTADPKETFRYKENFAADASLERSPWHAAGEAARANVKKSK